MMKITIRHLKDGTHEQRHTYPGGSLSFYRHEIYPHDIDVHARLNKFAQTVQCLITINTVAAYHCDRCLALYNQPVQVSFDLLLQLGDAAVETDEENVLHLPMDAEPFDLTELIAEHLILAVPMKMLCTEDCKGLCAGCGQNLNESACTCQAPGIDPRWEKLLALRKN